MSKAQHTPGPWHYVISESLDWDGWYSIIGEGSPDLAVAVCSWSGGAIRDGIDAWGEEALEECRAVTLANAALIAAAPDLLNAAETLLTALKWEENRSGTTYNGYETLRDVIARARGEGS